MLDILLCLWIQIQLHACRMLNAFARDDGMPKWLLASYVDSRGVPIGAGRPLQQLDVPSSAGSLGNNIHCHGCWIPFAKKCMTSHLQLLIASGKDSDLNHVWAATVRCKLHLLFEI